MRMLDVFAKMQLMPAWSGSELTIDMHELFDDLMAIMG